MELVHAEPLVRLRRLIRLDAALAEVTMADPELVAMVFAGLTADVVRTLPSEDAWRTVELLPALADDEAAERPACAGPTIPGGAEAPRAAEQTPWNAVRAFVAAPGAAALGRPAPSSRSGAWFGTRRDGTRIIERVWSSPERDPECRPLADELSPAAARVLIGRLARWRVVWDETRVVVEDRTAWRPGDRGRHLAHSRLVALGDREPSPHEVLTDAPRWASWRRRAYGIAPAEGVWPYESAHHWAMWAFDLLEHGRSPDEDEIDRNITFHRIAAVEPEAGPLARRPVAARFIHRCRTIRDNISTGRFVRGPMSSSVEGGTVPAQPRRDLAVRAARRRNPQPVARFVQRVELVRAESTAKGTKGFPIAKRVYDALYPAGHARERLVAGLGPHCPYPSARTRSMLSASQDKRQPVAAILRLALARADRFLPALR